MDLLTEPTVAAQPLTISRLHQNTGEVLHSVRLVGTFTVVDRHGDPVARLVPAVEDVVTDAL
jgi:antitoxin (DNA-binding transcriptional repressor) of toxin-antitoxin stability system